MRGALGSGSLGGLWSKALSGEGQCELLLSYMNSASPKMLQQKLYLAFEQVALIRSGFGALFCPEDWQEGPLHLRLYGTPLCTTTYAFTVSMHVTWLRPG